MAELTLNAIVNWLTDTAATFRAQGVETTQQQSPPEINSQSAFADFFTKTSCGRITGRTTGEFDLEVIDLDGRNLFVSHAEVMNMEELSEPTAQFRRALLRANPQDA